MCRTAPSIRIGLTRSGSPRRSCATIARTTTFTSPLVTRTAWPTLSPTFAGMLAADCAAFDLEDAGEEVPDDPRDPKFLTAAGAVMDGLRERALGTLNVPAEEAACMCHASKDEPPSPDAGSCPACGGAFWAPHFYVWHGVSMNVCNGCSGDRALMDAAAARLRSERAGGESAGSPPRHLRGI